MGRVLVLFCYEFRSTYSFCLLKGQFMFKRLVNEELVLPKQNGATLSTSEHLRWNELYSSIFHQDEANRVS